MGLMGLMGLIGLVGLMGLIGLIGLVGLIGFDIMAIISDGSSDSLVVHGSFPRGCHLSL